MSLVTFDVNETQIRNVAGIVRAVGRNVGRAVLAPAINATAKELGKSSKNPNSVSRLIRRQVNIKKRDIDKHIGIERATDRRPTGRVTLSESKRIELKYFGARQTRSGVTYKIPRAGGRSRIACGFGPEIPRLGGQVFVRVGPKRRMERGRYAGKMRQPIVKRFGPSPWGVFVLAKLLKFAVEDAQERLDKNIERRVDFILRRAAGEIN